MLDMGLVFPLQIYNAQEAGLIYNHAYGIGSVKKSDVPTLPEVLHRRGSVPSIT